MRIQFFFRFFKYNHNSCVSDAQNSQRLLMRILNIIKNYSKMQSSHSRKHRDV
jgi:hypothetical protein